MSDSIYRQSTTRYVPGRLTMREITRAKNLRCLKAYGLRVRGMTYAELGRVLERREYLSWASLARADKPITRDRARQIAMQGAHIVRHFHSVRRRPCPLGAIHPFEIPAGIRWSR